MSQKGLSESKTQILNTLRQDLTAVANVIIAATVLSFMTIVRKTAEME